MPSRTIEFRQIVDIKSKSITPQTRNNVKRREKQDEHSYDLFTKEANRIYQHVISLKRFLLTIRPAYLSTSKRPSNSFKTKPVNFTENDSLFTLFSGQIQSLTDQERDEIDFQAKLIIRRCIDRIKELEESEVIRQKNEESSQNKPLAFLSSFLKQPSSTEDILYVHRSSITWFLNQKLMEVSQIQKDQQEIRLSREIEKSENQLSKSLYVAPPLLPVQPQEVDEDIPLDPFEEELSKEQVQMLEKENSVMLEELNNTLNQIKSAEKALLEISTLQTQLTNHLAAQTIQTDRLYADAILTNEKVEQGNLQLFSARERNKSSRKFMLAFLIGASFVLLFLDWYS